MQEIQENDGKNDRGSKMSMGWNIWCVVTVDVWTVGTESNWIPSTVLVIVNIKCLVILLSVGLNWRLEHNALSCSLVRSPSIHLSIHFLSLLWGRVVVAPGFQGVLGLTPGSSPSLTCPDHLPGEASLVTSSPDAWTTSVGYFSPAGSNGSIPPLSPWWLAGAHGHRFGM